MWVWVNGTFFIIQVKMAGSQPFQEPESVTPVPAPGPEVWPPEGWVSTGGGGGEGRQGVVTGTSADVADFYST